MQEEYKGYTIEYREWCNKFYAKIGDSTYENADLVKVRKHIDDLDKKDFVRTSVLCGGRWGGKGAEEPHTITSEFREGSQVYAWVINSKKERAKKSIGDLYEDTTENRAKLVLINEMSEKQSELCEQKEIIRLSMTKYKSQLKDGGDEAEEK